MTARQRFLKVIQGEMPDRVPVTLFMADQGHFMNQVYPSIDPWDFEAIQLKIIEIQKQLGVDVFVRLLYMDPEKPLYFTYGGLNANSQTENWEVHTEDINNGNTLIKRTLIKTPLGNLTQDFSINEMRKGTFMYACTKKPIESPEDLEIAIKYEPPLSDSEKDYMRKRVKTIKAALGEDGIIGAWTPGGPFNNAACLINHEELYSMFITDNEYYERLMDFAGIRIQEYTSVLDEAGVDVLCSGVNIAIDTNLIIIWR